MALTPDRAGRQMALTADRAGRPGRRAQLEARAQPLVRADQNHLAERPLRARAEALGRANHQNHPATSREWATNPAHGDRRWGHPKE